MNKLEEILNNLISIDEECRSALNELQNKKDNIEYLVNDELSKRKDEIKTKYKFKIDMRQNEYNMKLANTTKNMDREKQQELEKIHQKYMQEKNNIITEIVNSII